MPAITLEEERTVITPNPGGQQQFAEDWEHFLVGLEGGWYSGKSFIGAAKLDTLHEYNAFDKAGQPTYVASLCVGPTYPNVMDFCVPHLQAHLDNAGIKYHWKETGSIAKGKWYGPAIIVDDFGTHHNPSVILIRSADIPKRIAGFTVGAGWADEPARWKSDSHNPLNDPFIQTTGRIRDVRANLIQLLLTYTNEGDATQVYKEMRTGGDDRALYRAPTKENPVAEDYYEQQAQLLTPDLIKQYLDGEAASLSGGRVYNRFDCLINTKPNLVLRPSIPMQLSLDFNIMPGMHGEIGQYHHDLDLLTTLYEFFGPRMTVEQLMDAFVRKTKTLKWKWSCPLELFGDATGRSEWAGVGQSCWTIVRQKLDRAKIPYRLRVPKANPFVIDRINAVNCACLDVAGGIHYHIHPRCKRLIKDRNSLMRDQYGEIDKTDRRLGHASDADDYRIWFIRPVTIERPKIGGRVGFG